MSQGHDTKGKPSVQALECIQVNGDDFLIACADNSIPFLKYYQIYPLLILLVLMYLVDCIHYWLTQCITQSGKDPHKLLIIGTTGFRDEVLELTGLQGAFNSCIEVPYLTNGSEVLTCLLDKNMYTFSETEIKKLEQRLAKKRCVVPSICIIHCIIV